MAAGADFWLRPAFYLDNLRRFETGEFPRCIFFQRSGKNDFAGAVGAHPKNRSGFSVYFSAILLWGKL
jgi:hypothetical protein